MAQLILTVNATDTPQRAASDSKLCRIVPTGKVLQPTAPKYEFTLPWKAAYINTYPFQWNRNNKKQSTMSVTRFFRNVDNLLQDYTASHPVDGNHHCEHFKRKPVPRSKPSVSVIQTSQLMPYREIIGLFSDPYKAYNPNYI